MRGRLRAAIIVVMLLVLYQAVPGRAENAEVTIGVGDTILYVTGKTSPGGLVTFIRDGSTIGAATANSIGEFNQSFPAQEPGLHTLELFTQTISGDVTDKVELTVNIAQHATTTVDVFLPSTLELEDVRLEAGQVLRLRGETIPSSNVLLFVDSAEYVSIIADSQGKWQAAIPTGSLASGQHRVFAKVVDGSGNQSHPTSLRFFSVGSPPPTIVPPILRSTGLPRLPFEGRGRPSVPVILFPRSGAVWYQSSITVRGYGDPGVQIELWDDKGPIASVWSNAQGEWFVVLDLHAKEYVLRARACLQGICSALSQPTLFTYTSREPPPLKIAADQYTFTTYVGEPLTIKAQVTDGQTPYEVTVNWGDQHTSKESFSQNHLQSTHRYSLAGKYIVTLVAKDINGRSGQVVISVDVGERHPAFWILVVLLLLAVLLLSFWLKPWGWRAKLSSWYNRQR